MDEPLPGMPEVTASPARPVKPGVTVSKAAGTHLCQQCCRLIHALGVSVAPYPRGGRWRVRGEGWAEWLCDTHKDERLS